MLIEELDIAVVDTFRNFLADLVRGSSLDHIEARPSVLGFGAGRCTHEEVVFQLALESVLFDVVGKGNGDFSRENQLPRREYRSRV
jgi:hypothetical protein